MGGRREIAQDVRESDLAALVGLPTRQLQDIVACLVPSKRRGEERWFWWRDIEGFLDPQELRAARKALRALRMKPHGSKYWVAGHPHLVSQWHPTKNGELLPDEVTYGSGRMIWWKCPEGPDHEWKARATERTRGDGCPYCRGFRVSVTNSLATLAPGLAAQWHPSRNGSLRPDGIVAGSARRVWWKCPKGADHEWRAVVASRVDGRGCPCCAGKRASVTNSIASPAPHLARQWHPTRNRPLTPRDVTPGSGRLIWWKCPKGRDHEWRAAPSWRIADNSGCPQCSGRRASSTNNLASTHRELVRQWHPVRNGELQARDVTYGSTRQVWWQCPSDPRHAWQASPNARTNNATGCPLCAGQCVDDTNCLATRHPEVAKEWHRTRNGRLTPNDVHFRTQRRIWWRCVHGHVWRARAEDRTGKSSGCPRCFNARRRAGWRRRRYRRPTSAASQGAGR